MTINTFPSDDAAPSAPAAANPATNALVQKLWNFCNLLRDSGLSYGDYLQQITTLLFLKMADERTQAPYFQESVVPVDLAWPTLMGWTATPSRSTTATCWRSWAGSPGRSG